MAAAASSSSTSSTLSFADACREFNTAPRDEPMSREVQDAMIEGLYRWERSPSLNKYETQLFYWIGGEPASMVRGPHLCAILPDKLLDSVINALNNTAWRPLPDPDAERYRQGCIRRALRLVYREDRIRQSDPVYDLSAGDSRPTLLYPGGVMPDHVRQAAGEAIDAKAAARVPYPYEQSDAAPYMYTDPVSGMQRRHVPGNYAHLRREVGLPATHPGALGVGSLRSLAFNAFAQQQQQQQQPELLPESLADELSIRRKMVGQLKLATDHAAHARIQEASMHTRNALAYEKQLVKKGYE